MTGPKTHCYDGKVMRSYWLSVEVADAIITAAFHHHCTRTEIVERAIKEWIEAHKEKAA